MTSKFHRKNAAKRGSNSDSNRDQSSGKCSIATQKRRISFLNFLQMFLWILLLIRQISQFYQIKFENSILSHLLLSEHSPWEIVWLAGTIFVVIITQISIRTRSLTYLRFSDILIVCFNIVPIIYAIVIQFQQLYSLFSDENKSADKYVVIVWYLFFLISVQVHGFALYFGESLLSQWSTNSQKKHKK